MKSTTRATTTEALAEAMAVLGYLPGAPACIGPDARAIDAKITASARCPACGHRGMTYNPMHRGTSYKILGTCSRCGSGEEL